MQETWEFTSSLQANQTMWDSPYFPVLHVWVGLLIITSGPFDYNVITSSLSSFCSIIPKYTVNLVFEPTDKCNSHPSLRKILFATDEERPLEKTMINPNVESWAQSQQTTQLLTGVWLGAQGTFQKRGWEDCKTQGIKEFAVRLCLLRSWHSGSLFWLGLPSRRLSFILKVKCVRWHHFYGSNKV